MGSAKPILSYHNSVTFLLILGTIHTIFLLNNLNLKG
jgi:hypothetical protein